MSIFSAIRNGLLDLLDVPYILLLDTKKIEPSLGCHLTIECQRDSFDHQNKWVVTQKRSSNDYSTLRFLDENAFVEWITHNDLAGPAIYAAKQHLLAAINDTVAPGRPIPVKFIHDLIGEEPIQIDDTGWSLSFRPDGTCVAAFHAVSNSIEPFPESFIGSVQQQLYTYITSLAYESLNSSLGISVNLEIT